MAKPNKGLGRGLDALLSMDKTPDGDILQEIKIGLLRPGKYQPRSQMDEDSLKDLAASIKAQGIMQPILAREVVDGNYEIIAGERRWRAAQLAGLLQVPVLIRKVADNAALAMALIENIQREDLNPLEEAIGLQRLIDEFQMTHQEAADSVGRSRSAASNLLRLLKLPATVQEHLMQGALDMGHARAILAATDSAQQVLLANKIILEGLSVRETEKLVQQIGERGSGERKGEKKMARENRDTLQLEQEMSELLSAKVEIKPSNNGGGKLIIKYSSNDHLEEFLRGLKKRF